MQVTLKETERIDDLQLKGLKLIQDKTGFCFGIDAVLLANFAKVKNNAKVVDLGTGTGIIPILIAGKSKASKIIGVEIQEEVYETLLFYQSAGRFVYRYRSGPCCFSV